MGFGFLGSVWRRLTPSARQRLVRLSQTTFTVSCAAVVINSEGEVLLLDHVLRPTDAGWGLPGGFVEAGEEPQRAIARELMEETGVVLLDIAIVTIRTFGRHMEVLFHARTEDEGSNLAPNEIKDLGWFKPKALPKGLPEGQRAIVRQVFDGKV